MRSAEARIGLPSHDQIASVLVRLALCMLGLLSLAPAARAQDQVETIRAVEVDSNADDVPDRLGQLVEVEGILLSKPIALDVDAAIGYIQDATGGLTLFSPDTSLLVGRFEPGDLARVRGVVGQYAGAEQIVVESIELIDRGAAPAPMAVQAATVARETYSGSLVQVAGRLRVSKEESGLLRVELQDSSGSIPVRISSRFLSDPEFVADLRRGGEAEITGIASQYKEEPPFDSGYQLLPRDPDDVMIAPAPPYREAGIIIIALMIIAGVAYSWARRRQAERRASELGALTEEMRRSERRFRALVENAEEIITVVDVDGTVKYQSPALERVLGYQPVERMGRNGFHGVHPEDLDKVKQAFEQAIETKTPTSIEFRARHRDGSYRILWATGMSLVDDPGVAGIVINSHDVTDLRRTEESLRQAHKLEAVGRLAGGIAHDFNNVLAVIKGRAGMALQELAEDSHAYEDIQEIDQAADRATRLTRQLLAFSGKQVLQLEVLDLNECVVSIEQLLRRTLGEDIEFVTSLDPQLWPIEADPGEIEQILMNLAVNARDAMPTGGKLITETQNVEVSEAFASQAGFEVPPGSYAMLSVSDTGTGIPEEIRERIFEPFFTTKSAGKGTGLGLATVYNILKHSGGYISVHTEEGRGCRFRIYLPRAEAEQRAEAQLPIQEIASRKPATILLTEDEVAVRATARRMLEQMGYRVLEAGNGEEAMRVAEEHRGEIDLLLTDVVMPLMGGVELAERLTARWPSVRVLFTSGYTDESVVRLGILNGSTDFLQKPYQRAALESKVADVLGWGE